MSADAHEADSSTAQIEDRKVCFCHSVQLSRILEEIRAGAVTLEELRARTRASTGCGGCEFELVEILEAELAKANAAR